MLLKFRLIFLYHYYVSVLLKSVWLYHFLSLVCVKFRYIIKIRVLNIIINGTFLFVYLFACLYIVGLGRRC